MQITSDFHPDMGGCVVHTREIEEEFLVEAKAINPIKMPVLLLDFNLNCMHLIDLQSTSTV